MIKISHPRARVVELCTFLPPKNKFYVFALYFILSRDVPILKLFSAGRPKIIDCCSGGCSAVAAVVAYCRGRRKQRIALPNFSFSNMKGKSIQSVSRSHNDFLCPMKHDLEILSCEN